MTITPRDILEIQFAIERYKKAFPKKPSPTPEEALAWQASKRLRPAKGSSAGIGRVRSLVFGLRARGE
jgi:hypothetical protein